MATGFDPRLGALMNPLNNPYWGTSGDGGIGGANGRGVFNWEQLAPLGYDVGMFAEQPMGDDVSPGAINPQATADWLAQNGLQLFEQPGPNGGTYRYVADASGQIVGEPLRVDTNDTAFFNAALLGIGGAGLAAYGAGVGAAGGAAGGSAAAGGGNALATGLTSATGGYGGLTGGGLLTGGAVPATGGAGLTLAGAGGGGLAGYGGVSGAIGGAGALGAGAAAGTGAGMSTGWLGLSPNTWANLGSTALGLWGQNRQLDAMQSGANQANEFNRYAFDAIRSDNQPLVNLRNSVLPQIQNLLSNPGSITNDPSYQFQLAEGMKARQNSAAGAGMTYSGAQQKALTRYGQDYAGTKLDQSLNRLTNVAGLGQVGNNQTNQATSNFASNAGNNALNMGSARGSAYGNMAGMANNALLNVFNDWQYRDLNGGP